jgi:hypothetical protein
MRVLITNLVSWPLSGTVSYVRDLALGLRRRGSTPALFSTAVGPVCDQLRAVGIPVVSRLANLPWTPSVIHGHHALPLSQALARWPQVPAIAICHDHRSMHDRAVLHPAVRRYLAVSEVCRHRLVADGVPADRVDLLFNFVDVERCPPRPPLPARPRRALVFSNHANESTQLPAVREACRRAGLTLDVIGHGVGRHEVRPEDLLGSYDLVFAKAKAAMEAMAVGTAVVLCDFAGVGPLVTAEAFDTLRVMNFGHQALTSPLTADALVSQIARYDAADAARVSARVRTEASLEVSLDRLQTIYRECIALGPPEGHVPWTMRARHVRDGAALALFWRWLAVPEHQRARLRGFGVNRFLHAGLARTMGAPRPE